MQKTHSRSRTILLSVLMVLMCVSLIVGATFALFVDKEEYAIGVNTGNIDVQGTLTMTGAWSEGQSVNNREAGTQITNGYSLPQGGSVTLTEDKNITFTNMSLGDGAAFNLKVTNGSSVDMKYSVRVEVDDDASPANSEALAKSLTLSVLNNGETGRSVTFENAPVSVIDWTTVTAPAEAGEIAEIDFEITLPWDTINNFDEVTDSQSISMTIVLEAVQANAFTGTIGSGDQSYDSIKDAIDNIESGATISLGGGITAEWPSATEMENVDKAFNVYGAGKGQTTIEPASEEDSVVLPAGSSISNATIAGNVVAGENTVLDNVTVTGTVTYTKAEDAGTQSFSTLAKVSRAAANEATATVTLTNAMVEVENATTAISISGANLVLNNCTVTLTNNQNASTAGINVFNGSVNIVGSTIHVINNGLDTNSTCTTTGLNMDNTATELTGVTETSATSVVSDSEIIVETDYVYWGYESFNDAAIRLSTVRLEVVDSTLRAGMGIGVFYNSEVTVDGGLIDAVWYGISGNNTLGSAYITITGGAEVRAVHDSRDTAALYIPMYTVLNIDNATIYGYTGLQMRMGKATISNATITSYADGKELTATDQSTPDGSAILFLTREYGFADKNNALAASTPAGYVDEFAGNNSLNVTINANVTLRTEGDNAREISLYDWRKVDQSVQINNYTQYKVICVATSAAAFEGFYTVAGFENILLAQDITIDKLPNLGNTNGTYFAGEGREEEPVSGLFPIAKDSYIDLNGKTLIVTGASSSYVLHGYSLTITNGNLNFNGVGDTTGALIAQKDSSITLDGVTFTTTGCALFPMGNAAEINVSNSTVNAKSYAVSTNAAVSTNSGVIINLENSDLTSNTGILFNVVGTLNMNNCVVNSVMQSVIVRGGTATIENCTLNNSLPKEDIDAHYFENSEWGTGNAVPLAAIVVGNRTAKSYEYPASATLIDVVTNVSEGALNVYLYGNTAENDATLTYSYTDEFDGTQLSASDITIGGGYVTVNGDETVLSGQLTVVDGANVTLNNVNIMGTDSGVGTAITVGNGSTLTMNGGSISTVQYGIMVNQTRDAETSKASNVALVEVAFSNIANKGVYFEHGGNITITGCTFTEVGTGINSNMDVIARSTSAIDINQLYTGGAVSITGNTFTKCGNAGGSTSGAIKIKIRNQAIEQSQVGEDVATDIPADSDGSFTSVTINGNTFVDSANYDIVIGTGNAPCTQGKDWKIQNDCKVQDNSVAVETTPDEGEGTEEPAVEDVA